MRAVDCGRSKCVKAVRAYVCFLEREVYAFLSTFDKRGEGSRRMLRARIFCLWEGRGSRRANDDGPAASGAREVVNESNTRKGRSGVFFSWRRVLFSLLQERKNINAAALGCMGSRGFMGIDRPRESLCVGGFAQGCAAQGRNPACGGLIPWRPAAAEVPAYPAYRPQIPMWEPRVKGIEVSLFSLTLYIQYIIKFGGCQKWKLEEKGKGGKFWKARDCWRWGLRRACVGGNGREVRWLPPNIFFLTFL